MESSNYQDITRRVLEAYTRLTQSYTFCMQHTLQKYGLYEGQPAVLFKIKELRFPNQNELAVALGVSKSSVGVSLRRLEKGGFIKREQDLADSRCNRITLTKKGEEFAHWCEMDMDMMANNMLELFDADERFRVLEILERMQSGMNDMKARIRN